MRITFENGLDPGSILDVYVLAKGAPGETVTPSLRMHGTPGTIFKEDNSPSRLHLQSNSVDPHKIGRTPYKVRAIPISDKILIWWDTNQISHYASAKIFRSRQRHFGDYGEVGQEIFSGHGETNRLTVSELITVTLGATDQSTPSLQQFFERPPGPRLFPHPLPGAPAAPTGLRAVYEDRVQEEVEAGPYFIDTPPEREVTFTYTIYTFDLQGNVSYPVMANALLDSTSQRRTIEIKP